MSGDGRVIVYRDQAGEYRWTDVAGNGEPIADSSEGHVDRSYTVGRALTQAHGRTVTFRQANNTEIVLHAEIHRPDPTAVNRIASQLDHAAAEHTNTLGIDVDLIREAADLLRAYATRDA